MIVRLTRRARGMVAGGVLGAATIVATVAGADVSFSRNGPFEVCLNGAYAAWLRHQAELLVNDDKRARSLNDTSVAAWTGATLDDCRKKGEATPGRGPLRASHGAVARSCVRPRGEYSAARTVGLGQCANCNAEPPCGARSPALSFSQA